MSQHKLCQFIAKKHIKDNINWPREIKIGQRLTKRFKEFEFWDNLRDFKLPSLAWFLKSEGKAFLLSEYEKFKLNLNVETVKLEENKVQDDKKICKKPKSLIEFIRYGKKI
jgi:hypothetical protein